MSARALVHMLMEKNEWIAPYQIQGLAKDCGIWCSESAITARLREMRSMGYLIQTRPAKSRNPHSRVVEYKAERMN